MAKSKKHIPALKEKEGIPQPRSWNDAAAQNLKNNRKKLPTATKLAMQIIEGNKTALSRGITLVESTASKHKIQASNIIESCLPYANKSIRIGITGVPGVGKSTFIEKFGKLLIQRKYKVAVLAVDPSSSLSKGSILGDKTRMEDLVKEENAFIRPSASAESLGGVARKTREAIILCEAAGFDAIIIETVGVGQSETAVSSMTDFFLLLNLTGAGDELQGIKRGIMEMADAIVINKADGDNINSAKLLRSELNRALHLYPPKDSGWKAETFLCSALKNEGIEEILKVIENYMSESGKNGYFQQNRNQQNKFWLLQTIETGLISGFYNNSLIKPELEKKIKEVEANEITPFEAANYLLGLKK